MTEFNIKSLFDKYYSAKTDNDIYHDLMPFKVKEILLIASIYDAFIMEQEDKLTDKLFGEYHQLNLSNAPRITSVSNDQDALQLLKKKNFDLVIMTLRFDEVSPFNLIERIKKTYPGLPVILLLSDNTEIPIVKEREHKLQLFDKVFVWNGDSKIFLAMIKYIEDKVNVKNDTEIGLVRVILLVEDSIRYLSRYLPLLYTVILRQTQSLIQEEHLDEAKKLLRMRARPKILVAETYEQAIELYAKYQEFIIGIISDVSYPRNGVTDDNAGIELIKYIRKMQPSIAACLQSSDAASQKMARELNATFINKYSENLNTELHDFMIYHLGMGPFNFKDTAGKDIFAVNKLEDLREALRTIPIESLKYHAELNHFSTWLMARGEIQIAKKLKPYKLSDFPDMEAVRTFLIDIFQRVSEDKLKGKIINYERENNENENFIFRLAEGTLGGKGRGLAFINSFIHNSAMQFYIPGVEVKIPSTAIIGTNEFETFLANNDLESLVQKQKDFNKIKNAFLKASLSYELINKLRDFLNHHTNPLIVRSSSLFEDSVSQPFSGIYHTYFLPNNQPKLDQRLKQLTQAIKLVYASAYSDAARAYIDAVGYKNQEDNMAVIIQDLVGKKHGDFYYPDFSGVAQSYNYYPLSYFKPTEGLATVALGLGQYVVDGNRSYVFCPAHPKKKILSAEELLRHSQTFFYALDLQPAEDNITSEYSNLAKVDYLDAESDGVLQQIASVWDSQNTRLTNNFSRPGTRIIDFAPILNYDSIPLAKTIKLLLDVIRTAVGTPIEIEFTVDLAPNNAENITFYILQIKPLVKHIFAVDEKLDAIPKDQLLLYTNKGMGNGTITDLCDVIYIDPDHFDISQSKKMATELAELNRQMKEQNRRYILIGPGRWGSRDEWLGIPVRWDQIAQAKVIIESGIKDFQVDPSLGSHFFHNITSMDIGYFAVPYNTPEAFIDWDWLKSQPIIDRTDNFMHAVMTSPLTVIMDGRRSLSLIKK